MYKFKFDAAVCNAALILALTGVSGAVTADQYSITYTGVIDPGRTNFPELIPGELYTTTLVFDNGSSSPASQTWVGNDLTCAIWTANNARDVVVAVDLTLQTNLDTQGSVSTDGAGALTNIFDFVEAFPVDVGTYSSIGIALVDPLHLFWNDRNDVFYSDFFNFQWADTSGGVQMNVASWTDPVPYAGSCSPTAPPPPPPPATPVPTLPFFGLLTLGGLLGIFGVRQLKA